MKILAIESSADETAAAVVEDGTTIISNVVASSAEMNKKYGGIVPEVAAREQLSYIIPVIIEALKPLDRHDVSRDSPESHDTLHATRASESSNDHAFSANEVIMQHIDAIAVSVGPGLIGSLLIGVETAKTIAFVTKKPIIPVNHVLAHMYANFIDQPSVIPDLIGNPSYIPTMDPRLRGDDKKIISFPAISLVVSGGHTELYLMKSEKDLQWLGGTLDDAAGEAFDKTARLLGFGTGGGVAIQEAALKQQASIIKYQINLPRPMMYDQTHNFSFSGLKTAILREVNKLKEDKKFNDESIRHLAYEVQETITDVLIFKTIKAAHLHDAKSILLSGGVSANLRLREKFNVKSLKFQVFAPPVQLCTDNAVYIASYAFFRGKPKDWHTITAQPDMSVEEI